MFLKIKKKYLLGINCHFVTIFETRLTITNDLFNCFDTKYQIDISKTEDWQLRGIREDYYDNFELQSMLYIKVRFCERIGGRGKGKELFSYEIAKLICL